MGVKAKYFSLTHLHSLLIKGARGLLAEGGVQNSSTSNHRHTNVFCGKRAPQLVISTTSIGNKTIKTVIS